MERQASLPTTAKQAECLFELAGDGCSAEDAENTVSGLNEGSCDANPSNDRGKCSDDSTRERVGLFIEAG